MSKKSNFILEVLIAVVIVFFIILIVILSKSSYVYSFNEKPVTLGKTIPKKVEVYHNYKDVMKKTNHNFFVRYKLEKDKVVESAVGFFLNNKVHYLDGGTEKIQYKDSVSILRKSFGAKKCLKPAEGSFRCNQNCIGFNEDENGKYESECTLDKKEIGVMIDSSGGVEIYDSSASCTITTKGEASCKNA